MQILWGSTILWLNPYFYLILAIKAIFDCFCNCKSTWITLLCVSKQGVIQKRTNFKIEHGTGFCYDFMLGLVTREVYITYLMILQITLSTAIKQDLIYCLYKHYNLCNFVLILFCAQINDAKAQKVFPTQFFIATLQDFVFFSALS